MGSFHDACSLGISPKSFYGGFAAIITRRILNIYRKVCGFYDVIIHFIHLEPIFAGICITILKYIVQVHGQHIS